jgi:MFS family permease
MPAVDHLLRTPPASPLALEPPSSSPFPPSPRLPFYIRSTPIQGRLLSVRQAGDLSTLFDVGGVAGGILAGHLSDKTGASALVATGFTVSCVPVLWLYRAYGHLSLTINVALMMACGFLVNGPYVSSQSGWQGAPGAGPAGAGGRGGDRQFQAPRPRHAPAA